MSRVARERFRGPVRPPGRDRRRRVDPPGQVRLRQPSTTSSPPATRARSSPPTARAPRCSASRRWPTIDDLPDGEADLVFVCTPAAANPDLLRACAAKGDQGRLHRLGRLRRGRGRGPAGPGRAGGPGRRARHPARRAQRPGRRSPPPRRAVRPDRGAVPAGRAHRHRQPVGQLRLVVHELRPSSTGVGRQPGRVGRQRRRGRRAPTTSSTTPTTPRPTVGLAYVEGIADGRAFFERLRRRGRAHADRRS